MRSLVSRLLAASAAALALTLPSLTAHAQGVDEFGAYGVKRGEQSESKQDSAYEFRVGRYVPEADDGVPNGTPFHDVFGNSPRFIIGAEADWQLFRIPHLGTLAPGFGFGLTKFTAKARFTVGGGLSSSDTRLWILPMHLVGVLRADVVSREFHIPFVPYAKLGLGYGLWWSSDGQKSAKAGGVSGKGASYGPVYALGGMFLLDVLDEDDAKSADGITGINNSYVFLEWTRTQLDGFGKSDVLDIGSSSWTLGVAVEM